MSPRFIKPEEQGHYDSFGQQIAKISQESLDTYARGYVDKVFKKSVKKAARNGWNSIWMGYSKYYYDRYKLHNTEVRERIESLVTKMGFTGVRHRERYVGRDKKKTVYLVECYFPKIKS